MRERSTVAGLQRIFAAKSPGQVLLLVTFALVALLGLSAVAIDVGDLWTTRHLMQTAADAGALAAVDAITIGQTTTSEVTSAAQFATAQNGFTNGQGTTTNSNLVTVSVTYPPTTGAYAYNSNAVEVTVAQDQPTFFMRVLGWNHVPVSTTAVGLTVSGGSCVYALDYQASGTIDVSGNGNLFSTCGVYDNSNDESSALIVGGTSVLSAPLVGVVGGTDINGGGSTPPTSGIAAFGDPLAWIPEPTGYSCSSYSTQNISSTTTLDPTYPPGSSSPTGPVYCGGLKLNSYADVTFNPGTYVIDGGGLTINAQATATGSNVTFYLTGANQAASNPQDYGGVDITAGSAVTLTAPCNSTAGGIEGMLFFQDRSITTGVGSTINGGSTSFFTGALYFPTTQLTYNGSSGSDGYTYIVADTLNITGTTDINNNYSCLAGGSIIKSASLVE